MRKSLITSVFVVVGIPYSLLAAEPNPYDVNKPVAQPSTAGQQPPAAEPQSPAAGQQPPAVAQSPATDKRQPAVEEAIESLKTDVKILQDLRSTLSSEVKALTDQQNELIRKVRELTERLDQIAKVGGQPNVIATEKQGAPVPVTMGTLEIQNNSGGAVELYVNGSRWSVPQGIFPISVPYGPVRVEFVHYQRDKDWTYSEKDWKRDGNGLRLPIQIVSGKMRPSS